jgi:hypothetical protein
MSDKRKFHNLRSCFNWLIQLALVSSIVMIVILATHKREKFHVAMLIIPISFYIIYTINSLKSELFTFLYNKHKANTIHEYMNSLYTTAPVMAFELECFHHKRGGRKKKVTYIDKESFYYYSWRDISGVFLLQTSGIVSNQRKAYIKLHLDLDISYPEDGTSADYNLQMNAFLGRNKGRDQHVSVKEVRELPGLKQFHMVRVSEKTTPFVNKYVYMFFTFVIPLVELYKLYINQFCEEQSFTVRKVISTRNDLNSQTYVQRYEAQVPKISIYGEEVLYKQTGSNVHESPYIPSASDLSFSQDYGQTEDHHENCVQNNFNNYNPMDVRVNRDAETKLI